LGRANIGANDKYVTIKMCEKEFQEKRRMEELQPSNSKDAGFYGRPFKNAFIGITVISVFVSFATIISGAAFIAGIFLSITWACFVYIYYLDQPHLSPTIRRSRAALGFFSIIVGLFIGALGPNYLNTQQSTTEWFVVAGLLIGAEIGFSLIMTYPLRSLSTWAGYMIAAIVLHSVILQFQSEFVDILGAKILVLALLSIGTWFLAQWIFFDRADPLTIDESKRAKNVRSFVGLISGLVTVIEFVNIMVTLYRFGK
jgi:hypothetical protein